MILPRASTHLNPALYTRYVSLTAVATLICRMKHKCNVKRQVCVDPPPSDHSTTLAACCCAPTRGGRYRSTIAGKFRRRVPAVDRYMQPPAPELRQTNCAALPLSINGTDGRTDKLTPERYILCGQRQKQRGKLKMQKLVSNERTKVN